VSLPFVKCRIGQGSPACPVPCSESTSAAVADNRATGQSMANVSRRLHVSPWCCTLRPRLTNASTSRARTSIRVPGTRTTHTEETVCMAVLYGAMRYGTYNTCSPIKDYGVRTTAGRPCRSHGCFAWRPVQSWWRTRRVGRRAHGDWGMGKLAEKKGRLFRSALWARPIRLHRRLIIKKTGEESASAQVRSRSRDETVGGSNTRKTRCDLISAALALSRATGHVDAGSRLARNDSSPTRSSAHPARLD